jgi:serine/threonine protein kinase
MLYVSRGEEYDDGSVLAEYKIIRELGQGGFGTVYEAKHRLTKEKVAIKTAESTSFIAIIIYKRECKGCRNDVQGD